MAMRWNERCGADGLSVANAQYCCKQTLNNLFFRRVNHIWPNHALHMPTMSSLLEAWLSDITIVACSLSFSGSSRR